MKKLFSMLLDEQEGQGTENEGQGNSDTNTDGNKEDTGGEPPPDEKEQELARIKAENEELKKQAAAASNPEYKKPVTSRTLEGYTEEQWEAIESKTGKDRATIMNEFRAWELSKKQEEIEAKTNVNDIIQEEMEKDPKLLKIRSGIKEYMSDVPLDRKVNPALLKKEMEKAIAFAKGKYMTTNNNASGSPAPKKPNISRSTPDTGEDGGGDEGYAEGEVKDDVYISSEGTKIKVGGRMSREQWKKVQHKQRDPNSVQISGHLDEKPKF